MHRRDSQKNTASLFLFTSKATASLYPPPSRGLPCLGAMNTSLDDGCVRTDVTNSADSDAGPGQVAAAVVARGLADPSILTTPTPPLPTPLPLPLPVLPGAVEGLCELLVVPGLHIPAEMAMAAAHNMKPSGGHLQVKTEVQSLNSLLFS